MAVPRLKPHSGQDTMAYKISASVHALVQVHVLGFYMLAFQLVWFQSIAGLFMLGVFVF